VRLVLAIGLILALGGCAVVAVPPAVTIASYAADGISYLATGKSLTDHAISEVADEDCVLFRVAVLKNPCRPYVEPDSELAVELEESYGGEEVSTELAEADLAAARGAGALAQRRAGAPTLASAASLRRAPAARPTLTRYVVVGSFRERANAERARRAHATEGAAVVPASVRGRSYYRVVTPLGVATPVRSAAGAPWTIAPCDSGAAGPCLDRASLRQVEGRIERRPAVAPYRDRPESQLTEDVPARQPALGG
jgi:hypothetical protein